MNKSDLTKMVKSAQAAVTKHSPEILTGLGIAGMFTSMGLAVRATPKAMALIEEKKKHDRVDELRPVDVVKTTWKCYIPAAVTAVASTACLIGASSVNLRRNAALAAAYKLSETTLSEYKDKVIESIGEKKEKEVRDKVNAERIEKNPVDTNGVFLTNKGNTLCYDPTSARYFRSDIDKIRKAENSLNKNMLHDIFGSVSLNDFYDEIGLEHTSTGDDLGWNTENLIDIHLGSHIASNGEPCIVLDHTNPPTYGFCHY